MKYRLKAYSIIEYGRRKDSSGRPHQEDCIYPAEGRLSDSDRTFILCDGMGGHDAGEVASASVCDAMGRAAAHSSPSGDGIFTQSDFEEALNAAFLALDEKDTHAAKKMGTTLTFLRLHEGGAFIAHIGDSRVYHIRPGKTGKETVILHETSDHSLVNELIKAGELTRESARKSVQKNVITRALQPNPISRPKADIYETPDIRPGDYFYLCSDGMLEQPDMENGTSLKNIFSRKGGAPADKVNILRSVTAHNKDNHSAIVIHIEDVMDKDKTSKARELRDTDRSDSDKLRYRNKSIVIFCIAGLIAAIAALIWKMS